MAKQKKLYSVPVCWEMFGRVVVEAENEEDAYAEVNMNPDIPLPQDGDYVEGSFEMAFDSADEIFEVK